jgi:hypothetical protein
MLVGFVRAARTRLFGLAYTQNGALCAPRPPQYSCLTGEICDICAEKYVKNPGFWKNPRINKKSVSP